MKLGDLRVVDGSLAFTLDELDVGADHSRIFDLLEDFLPNTLKRLRLGVGLELELLELGEEGLFFLPTQSVKPGGTVLIEDMYERSPFTDDERSTLK